MQLGKRQVFWIVFPIATAVSILCALYPAPALSISLNFGLPFLGAVLVLYGAWRTGGSPFGLLVLAILLTLASVLIERYAEGVIVSVIVDVMIDLALQVGALVSLIAAVVIGVRRLGFGMDD